jgi:hypothetical protein
MRPFKDFGNLDEAGFQKKKLANTSFFPPSQYISL